MALVITEELIARQTPEAQKPLIHALLARMAKLEAELDILRRQGQGKMHGRLAKTEAVSPRRTWYVWATENPPWLFTQHVQPRRVPQHSRARVNTATPRRHDRDIHISPSVLIHLLCMLILDSAIRPCPCFLPASHRRSIRAQFPQQVMIPLAGGRARSALRPWRPHGWPDSCCVGHPGASAGTSPYRQRQADVRNRAACCATTTSSDP